MINESILVVIANLMPSLEQVGGIPLGIALGLNPIYSLLLSLAVNSLLFFPVYFSLKFFYDSVFSKIKLFEKYLEKVRRKGKPYVDKYGILGLTLFISLPTPLTGTYTASVLSWFMDLDWKKSSFAIFLGSLMGGLIILGTTLGFIELLKLAFSI